MSTVGWLSTAVLKTCDLETGIVVLRLIKGVAKGVKKPKSKLGARMQSLVCNKLMLNEGKNLDVIKEAQAINPFNKLRYNLEKLNYSIYITEIIGNFCRENTEEADDINKNIYEIFYKTLENIFKIHFY